MTETVRGHSTIRGLVEIARVDHWFKNVFVLPGVVVAFGFAPLRADASTVEVFLIRLVLGLVAVCLVASSNYVLNEILDAPFDRGLTLLEVGPARRSGPGHHFAARGAARPCGLRAPTRRMAEGRASVTPSTSRRPSTSTVETSISTHTKAGRAFFIEQQQCRMGS